MKIIAQKTNYKVTFNTMGWRKKEKEFTFFFYPNDRFLEKWPFYQKDDNKNWMKVTPSLFHP